MSAPKKLFIIEGVLLGIGLASYAAMLCIKVPHPSAPVAAQSAAISKPAPNP